MRSTRLVLTAIATFAMLAGFVPSARAVITVYDLRVDFSNANNPNGPWRYYKGNTLLTHFTPVTNPGLAPAVSGGYWGDTASSTNSAIMLTSANGNAAPPFSNNDFLIGEVLVRTTDPSTGGAMNVTWTAPTSGTFTYSGFMWFANGPLGPGNNSFTLTLNNGPAIESGTATIGQDRNNVTGMVNGNLPTAVTAGDVLKLEIATTNPFPTGSLAGVSWTIDFTPVPEPSTLVLAAAAGLITVGWAGRPTKRGR